MSELLLNLFIAGSVGAIAYLIGYSRAHDNHIAYVRGLQRKLALNEFRTREEE